jgi:flagellin
MQAIYTNILSAMVQNTLNASQSQVTTAIQRLSTGLRVNDAADNAAGYAIAQRMSAQINGLNQAGENVNDGISMLQVADGAVSQITSNFQKIRTLAVEAANPTYSTGDRLALQEEADQLIATNAQISQHTNFNGINLLDGTYTNQQLQIGANPTQTLLLTIPAAFTQTSGSETVDVPLQQATVSAQVVSAIGASDLKIDGVAIGASIAGGPGQSSASAWAIANAINKVNIAGLTASASSSISATVNSGPISAGKIVINGVTLNAVIAGASKNALAASAASAINGIAASTGVTAASSGSTLTLSTADGRDISISGANALGLVSTQGTITLTTAASPYRSEIVISGNNPGNAGLSAGTVGSVDSGGTAPIPSAIAGPSADVTTAVNAEQTISYIDTQLANCNNISAYLGANQNVLASLHFNLTDSSSNLSAAQARIQDTDYAAATAALVRGQILQSAGMTMLAQANAMPKNIIRLLSA